MISPYSISVATLMLYYGAKTETARQLKKLLGVTGLSDDDILKLTKDQILSLNYNDVRSGLAMNTADRIFYKIDKILHQEYLDLLSTYFFSNATALDFKNNASGAAQTINNWVSDQTNGKIKDLLPPGSIDDTICIVLVNAIYFKGLWSIPFEGRDTKEDDFFLSDTNSVRTNMMRLDKKKFGYMENPFGLNVKVAHFSYKASPVKMTILLPNKDVKINDIEQKMTSDILNQIISAQGTLSKLNVSLPKFKFEFRDKVCNLFCLVQNNYLLSLLFVLAIEILQKTRSAFNIR
jgi:serpin B